MLCPVFLPHVGCSTRCIYCNQELITNIKGSDIEKIIKKSLPSNKKYEVGLFGGNIFGVSPSLLREIFSYFYDYRDNITGFRISTKPTPINEEILNILKENKVKVIELGIPAFNDKILKKLNRGYTLIEFYNSYEILKSRGFKVALQVMVGLPDEDRRETVNTVKNIKTLMPSYIRIYPLVILRDTPLYDEFIKGNFTPLDSDEIVLRTLYIYLNALSLNIPVVKMGLTENELIREKIAGGFYDPALGNIVKAEGFFISLTALFKKYNLKGKIVVAINKRDEPHLIGYRRRNLERWNRMDIHIEKRIEEMDLGVFYVQCGEKNIKGHILDGLNILSKEMFEN